MRGSLSYRLFGALMSLWFGVFNVALESTRSCAMHDSVVPVHATSMTHAGPEGATCDDSSRATDSVAPGAAPGAAADAAYDGGSGSQQHCPSNDCTCPDHCCSAPAVGVPIVLTLPVGSDLLATIQTLPADAQWTLSARADLQLPHATAPPMSRTALIA